MSVSVTVQSKPRSPGRPAKHRSTEVEMDVVVSGHVPSSLASVAVTMDTATATKSVEATEKPAGPQFVFSSPVFVDDKKGNGRRCRSGHSAWFLSLILTALAAQSGSHIQSHTMWLGV